MTLSVPDRRRFHLGAVSAIAGLAASRVAGASPMPAAQAADPIHDACHHPARLAADRARDATRQPQRVLEFFQMRPGLRVADIQAGDGYYTELVSRIVGKEGFVYCVNDGVGSEAKRAFRYLVRGRVGGVVRFRYQSEKALDLEFTVTLAEGIVTPLGVVPRHKRFVVSGIYRVGMYEYDSSFVFMPMKAAQLFYKLGDRAHGVELIVERPEDVRDYRKQIAGTEGVGRMTDWQQANAHFFSALEVERNVMFLILTLIQFIVIAKGSERVSEVAARFTLDALPGKQMSIDADLRAGLIDADEARRRMEHHLHESGVAAVASLERQGFWEDE